MMQPSAKTAAIITNLTHEFPHLALTLIQQNQQLSLERREKFAAHPDDPAEHAHSWHEFGIITHSKRFQQYLEKNVPHYLKEWGIAEPVQAVLREEIDGQPKGQLLHIAALLHDIGKFRARTLKGFKDHEEYSGKIIRTTVKPLLEAQGLTGNQIEYIASCAELHYELGKVRRAAKKQGNYNIAFTKTPEFRVESKLIQRQHPQFALEIGLCFLADNLSKVDIAPTGTTDEELQAQKPELEAALRKKSLPLSLANVALEVPTNVSAAEEYLKLWARVHQIRDLLWLKLTPESQQKLHKAFPPRYANQFGDHVTLTDDKTADELTEFVGKKGVAEVYAHATNGSVEAVRVMTHGLPDSYGVAHITLSTVKGVHPFTSVAMLRGEHSEQVVDPPLVLEGTIELRKR
jgi:hypothetical protein